MDAAALHHDHGYSQSLGGENMFGWQGMRNVREADRQLVADTQAEMDANGGKYSDGARSYSEGLRGFFGGRVMGMDAADWAGGKDQRGRAGHLELRARRIGLALAWRRWARHCPGRDGRGSLAGQHRSRGHRWHRQRHQHRPRAGSDRRTRHGRRQATSPSLGPGKAPKALGRGAATWSAQPAA